MIFLWVFGENTFIGSKDMRNYDFEKRVDIIIKSKHVFNMSQ